MACKGTPSSVAISDVVQEREGSGIKHLVKNRIPVFALLVSLVLGPSVPKNPMACRKSAAKFSLPPP